MRFRWFGSEFNKALRREAILKLSLCAEVVAGEARKLIRIPWKKRLGYRLVRNLKTGKTKKQSVYIYEASKPGEPPRTRRYQQGLLGSVFWRVNERDLTALVGTPMGHGLSLEIGTRYMKPRPWLRPALAKSWPKIQRIAERRMRNI